MNDRGTTGGDDAAHKVVDALLPWFVNGTLAPAERASVERHLAECSRCRQEADWLRGLHSACAEASATSAAAASLHRSLQGRRAARRAPPWFVAVALAAFAVAGTAWIATSEQASYRTLGAPDARPATRGALVVVFDPSTSEFDLRRIVRAAGARIVDGPTATNGYVLGVAEGDRERALAALRAERAVTLAERLDAGTAR
jgi:hypothetical protein